MKRKDSDTSDNHMKTYVTSYVLRELQTQIPIAKYHIYIYKISSDAKDVELFEL